MKKIKTLSYALFACILLFMFVFQSCKKEEDSTYNRLHDAFEKESDKVFVYIDKSNDARLKNDFELAITYNDSARMCVYTVAIMYEVMYP